MRTGNFIIVIIVMASITEFKVCAALANRCATSCHKRRTATVSDRRRP